MVLAAWLAIPPSNERDRQPDVATLAFADIHGDRVIVHNVRNAEYRTETDSATSRRSTSCASTQWYNALMDNCTTAIQRVARSGERRSWWSWKLFLNERARVANDDPRFSVRIRDGLPRMSLDRGGAG